MWVVLINSCLAGWSFPGRLLAQVLSCFPSWALRGWSVLLHCRCPTFGPSTSSWSSTPCKWVTELNWWFNYLFTNTNVDVLVIPGGGVGNIMVELLFNLVDVENVISFPFFVSSCGSFSHVFISSCDVFFRFFFRECLSFSSTPGAGTRLVLYWNIYSNPTVASKCVSFV